jgi:GxxExxY protein
LSKELSNKVIGLAYAVHRGLGAGLLESCYVGAMVIELEEAGIPFVRQQVYPLVYKQRLVGNYIADIVVANTTILEVKAVQALHPVMESQIINYLRLAKLPVGYLLNFNAPSLEFKRYVNQ